ncbi:peptidoglycan-binding domain-containing protein [Kordia jejudonensis]|uniref:peptidoglycan-binding domain-containing protein n=1 Tax=Kordia jejudonensis TaxID=1348245 RepID=UPI0006294418|nr:hypothetical protein [Kordia jejudonensis]
MSELPAYTYPEISGTVINQLGEFENILKGAENNGLVNKVPENKSEAFEMQHQKIRIQTIATRLYLLGYLRRQFNPKRIHKKIDKIKRATLAFQKDANLTQDSWVGDETWYALDELVSFESKFTHEKWFVDGRIKPEVTNAMHRAIQLRLWTLGLYSKKPRPNFKLLARRSLFQFTCILHMFLIRKKSFASDFNIETMELLFNQEGLVHFIKRRSAANNGFSLQMRVAKKEEDEIVSKSFIVNCAKIELWLLGFKVRIDKKLDYDYEYGSSMWNALAEFHREFEGRKPHIAEKLAKEVSPRLFVSMGNALKSEEEFKEDDASEEIAAQLFVKNNAVATKNNIQEAWGFIKETGMRLWDGLKRVWHWIKRIGKKVVTFIQHNLFKGFYRFVSKAFKIVTKGIGAIVKSIGVYIKGGMIANGMLFKFSKDYDTAVHIATNITDEDSEAGTQALLKQTTAFKLGCKMVGYLFYFFKNLSFGLLGWAKILFSLLKSYRKLRVFYQEFKLVAT